jgi:hypothetical protein
MGWPVGDLKPGRGKRFFFSPQHPDSFWGPHSPLFNGYQGSFLDVKQPGQTTHLHLVPRLRMGGAITLLSLYAFKAWTGRTSHSLSKYLLSDIIFI